MGMSQLSLRFVAMVVSAMLTLVLACAATAAAAVPIHTERPDLQHTGFTVPCGVAVDSSGNYYVADASAKTITIYGPTGSQIVSFPVNSFAAVGGGGPCKLDVDATGDVYVAGSGRKEVLRYKPEGAFPPNASTTYALDTSLNGNGMLAFNTLLTPTLGSVAVDPATQDVYVTLKAGNEIQEYVVPSENYKLKCDGDETAATLTPTSTAAEIKAALEAAPVECKTVTVTVVGGTRVRIVFGGTMGNKDVAPVEVIKAVNVKAFQMFNGSATPHVTGFNEDGTPISNDIGSTIAGAEFIGVYVFGKNGNVYVTDKTNKKVHVLSKAGNLLASFDGSDSAAGAFDFSSAKSVPDIAVNQSNGHAYVSDMQAHGVVNEFDGAGNFVSRLSHTPPFEEETSGNGIAVNNGASSPNKGTIYLTARTTGNTVKGVFAFGPLSTPIHTERPDLQHTGFTVPCGVAVDSSGNYYVADASAKTITIYGPTGSQIVSFPVNSFAAVGGGGPCKLDVDATGDVYVAGSGRKEVLRYKPEGAFPPNASTTYALDTSLNGNGMLAFNTLLTPTLGSVAVDPATQDVYVTLKAGNEIQEYVVPSENYKLKCDGDETAATLTPTSTAAEIKAALEAAPVECKTVTVTVVGGTRVRIVFGGTMGNKDVAPVEVIKAVNVKAFQMFNGSATPHVTGFNEDGTPISNDIGSTIAGAEFIGVDVFGKNGNVYVTDKTNKKVHVLSKAGNLLASFDGSDSAAGAFDFSSAKSVPDIAVNQSNGHAYVSDMQAHGVVDEFDGAGNFVSRLSHTPPFEEETSGNGIAVNNGASSPNKGTIYLTARTTGNTVKGVFAFGPLIYAFPLKVTKTGLGGGTVTSDPAGIDCGATCTGEFEAGGTVLLSVKADPGSKFRGWSEEECDEIVEVPEDEDECKIVMEGAREVSSAFDSRPLITDETATPADSEVEISAKVDPKGKATTYFFEYITAQQLQENEANLEPPFSGAIKLPEDPVAIGSGTNPIQVGVKAIGLEPQTTYRFRAVAGNAIGTAEGERDSADEEIPRSFTTFAAPDEPASCANEEFRTGPSEDLPDCRAYEQASPIDKNGGSIQTTAPAAATAEDGSTITFESTAGVPGGDGAQNFPTYMAKRGSRRLDHHWTAARPRQRPTRRRARLDAGLRHRLRPRRAARRGHLAAGALDRRRRADGDDPPHAAHSRIRLRGQLRRRRDDGLRGRAAVGTGSTTLQLTPERRPGQAQRLRLGSRRSDRSAPGGRAARRIDPDPGQPNRQGNRRRRIQPKLGRGDRRRLGLLQRRRRRGRALPALEPDRGRNRRLRRRRQLRSRPRACLHGPRLGHAEDQRQRPRRARRGRPAAGEPQGRKPGRLARHLHQLGEADQRRQHRARTRRAGDREGKPRRTALHSRSLRRGSRVHTRVRARDRRRRSRRIRLLVRSRSRQDRTGQIRRHRRHRRLHRRRWGTARDRRDRRTSAKYIFWTDRGELNEKGEPQTDAGRSAGRTSTARTSSMIATRG